ncbi:MAG: TetR/AcrR family transcriptional regulator [Thermodesulfobacteriota bacterium]
MNNEPIPSTKEKILDTAERLFSESGYHSTSLRAITGAAEVNLAAVNYHFGSKEALLEAVIERRLTPLNNSRIEMLNAVRSEAARSGSAPAVRDIMYAFIEPTLRFRQSGKGMEHFMALLGRAMVEPDDTVKKRFLRLMGPFIDLMLDSLKRALPELPQEMLVNRFHFTIGSLFFTMHACCQSSLPEGLRLKGPLTDELVDFVTAGMERI